MLKAETSSCEARVKIELNAFEETFHYDFGNDAKVSLSGLSCNGENLEMIVKLHKLDNDPDKYTLKVS